MRANREEDLYFLKLVQDKVLTVTKDGKIYDNIRKKFLNNNARSKGYRRLSYYGHGIQVHRLVWMAFNGLIPEGIQINHLKGVKYKNDIEFLELATNQRNTQHAYDIGLNKVSEKAKKASSDRQRGENNIQAKLTNKEVIFIRKEFSKGTLLFHQIESKYDLCKRSVENLLLGRSYKHIPYEVKKVRQNIYNNKLNTKQVLTIRSMYTEKLHTQKELGYKFNVSRSTIKDIISYRTYKNI